MKSLITSYFQFTVFVMGAPGVAILICLGVLLLEYLVLRVRMKSITRKKALQYCLYTLLTFLLINLPAALLIGYFSKWMNR